MESVKSVAIVTTISPTLTSFSENDVRRLVGRGMRVRVFALRGVGRQYQAHHTPLVDLTESVGSPLDLRGWWALLVRLLRRPGTLLGERARILRASRGSPCVCGNAEMVRDPAGPPAMAPGAGR